MTEPWQGFKELIVTEKTKESSSTVSLYLRPQHGCPLPKHKAGQFISIQVPLPGQEQVKPRQYTLSMKPGVPYYRISVKREKQGLISNYLHDQLQEGQTLLSTIPFGKFVLTDQAEPVILLGGGIGITPILSMLYELMEKQKKIILVQSMSNSQLHPFYREIKEAIKDYPQIKSYIFYTQPSPEDINESRFDYQGRITKAFIAANLPLTGDYYFCGPAAFMKTIHQFLTDLHVDPARIHYESFGPTSLNQ